MWSFHLFKAIESANGTNWSLFNDLKMERRSELEEKYVFLEVDTCLYVKHHYSTALETWDLGKVKSIAELIQKHSFCFSQ